MAKSNGERFSPTRLFILYLLVSCALILAFFMILPPEPPGLRLFSRLWRFTLAIQEYIRLFPALVMSALVIPFGLKSVRNEPSEQFSVKFIQRIQGPLFAALAGAILYALLFFLVLPWAGNREADMRFQSRIFAESKEKAALAIEREAWPEAAHFIAICEGIWPNNSELETVQQKTLAGLDDYLRRRPVPADAHGVIQKNPPNPETRNPVNAAEALQFARDAYQEERYYDAHWLAILAGRLASRGSVEVTAAVRMASMAWNAIASLAPNQQETRLYRLYAIKHTGYEAMIAEDWIRAYYIFQELSLLLPDDPDVAHFLVESRRGLAEIAFFADEMETTVGDVIAGAVFSLPQKTAQGKRDGRVVLRFGALSAFSDVSYGTDLELAVFDEDGRPGYRLTAPHIKILPKTLGDEHQIVFLLRALDRHDQTLHWEPVWEGPINARPGNTQVILDISYENFLLASLAGRGLDNFLIGDIFAAERGLGDYGYIPQVFQAEILTRLAEPVLFLPVLILVILLGWRFRSKRPPRYLGIPLLFLLPLVFNGIAHVYRNLIQTLGIWAILSTGFSTALASFIAGSAICLILALICLTAQHERS